MYAPEVSTVPGAAPLEILGMGDGWHSDRS